MAHKCLYCNKEIKPEDVLFVHVGESKGFSGRRSGTKKSAFGGFGNFESSANKTVESNETTDVNREYIGTWHNDDVYEDAYRGYLYMDEEAHYSTRSIYTVRWSKTEATPGCGKASDASIPPKSVTLCEEDIKNINEDISRISDVICPYCHADIPAGFFEAKDEDIERICMIGGSRAGKTQYILGFFQNAKEYLHTDEYQLGQVRFEKESDRILKYMAEQFREKGSMETTPFSRIMPLVFSIRPNSSEEGVFGKPRFVVLYDVPGEIFSEGNQSKMLSTAGLDDANSVMFLFDSTQVFKKLQAQVKACEMLGENGYDADEDEGKSGENVIKANEACKLDPYTMVSNITNYLNDKDYKRIAMVVTKIDYVWNDPSVCPDYFSVNMPRSTCETYKNVLTANDSVFHKGGVSLSAITDVNDFWTMILTNEEISASKQIIARVKNAFGQTKDCIKLFAVSTYRRPIFEGEFKEQRTADKDRFRVMEPMLYLLAGAEMLPYKKTVREDKVERYGLFKLKKRTTSVLKDMIFYPDGGVTEIVKEQETDK